MKQVNAKKSYNYPIEIICALITDWTWKGQPANSQLIKNTLSFKKSSIENILHINYICLLQMHGSSVLSQSKKSSQDTDDDDDDHPNTIVLANKMDKYTFDQVANFI